MQSIKRLLTRRYHHSLIPWKRNLSSLPINSSTDDLQNQDRQWKGILCWWRMKLIYLFNSLNAGKIEESKDFCRTIYSFIYHLGTYLKPHVAILNGITMGGGAGVSIPGTFRLATGRTVFATPETQIGFHPDAGASFHLSRLPGHLEELGNLVTDDPSVIESSLEKHSDVAYPEKISALCRIEVLDRSFGHDTVEEIIDALESEAAATNDAWCNSTLRKLKEASPLSLKVSLRSKPDFKPLTSAWFVRTGCPYKGYLSKSLATSVRVLRARVVDKDFAPKWEPPSLEKVSNDMVDQYFVPLSESEPDLELPLNSEKHLTSCNG
ncbi:hypothetical protein REPUB_Repub12eG0204400 [Reevesia pubescens]